jgi:hypothetical protein
MNCTRTEEFCTIERSPGRILLRVRHEPALLPGALTSTRHGARTLRGFAAHVASRLNEARSEKPARSRLPAK